MRDFDDNEFPLAYLMSMDRRHNVYGTSKIEPNSRLHESDKKQIKHPPVTLNARQRSVVESAIKEVCNHRPYVLRAINVRTNHVHTVVSAIQEPEPVLEAFKAYATRALRRANLMPIKVKPWVRHGSTVYLWKEKDVTKAVEYVMLGQGDDLFRLDDDQ